MFRKGGGCLMYLSTLSYFAAFNLRNNLKIHLFQYILFFRQINTKSSSFFSNKEPVAKEPVFWNDFQYFCRISRDFFQLNSSLWGQLLCFSFGGGDTFCYETVDNLASGPGGALAVLGVQEDALQSLLLIKQLDR